MTSEQSNTSESKTGNIVIDDIRNALIKGNLDPFATNAGALREITTRGGMKTIQKHLDAIRTELRPIAVVTPGTIPAAPTDVIKVLWDAAYSAVQLQMLGRLDLLTAQRDAAQETTKTQAQDVAALAICIDDLNDRLEAAAAKTATTEISAAAEYDQAIKLATARQTDLEAARSEILRITQDAKHAAELATRDALITVQAMQSTIDNLINQVAELKSVLIVRTTQAMSVALPLIN